MNPLVGKEKKRKDGMNRVFVMTWEENPFEIKT
jgi:hypothetical protein